MLRVDKIRILYIFAQLWHFHLNFRQNFFLFVLCFVFVWVVCRNFFLFPSFILFHSFPFPSIVKLVSIFFFFFFHFCYLFHSIVKLFAFFCFAHLDLFYFTWFFSVSYFFFPIYTWVWGYRTSYIPYLFGSGRVATTECILRLPMSATCIKVSFCLNFPPFFFKTF